MATIDEIQRLHSDLSAQLKTDARAALSSVQMALIRRVAEELLAADAKNTAAKTVLSQLSAGSRLSVADGLALVGQLLASYKRKGSGPGQVGI